MEKQTNTKDKNKNTIMVKIPIMNIRLITDEEWNWLAYKNYLKRKGKVSL